MRLLLLITVVVTVGLWASVKWFLESTHEYSSTLDKNSLSYLRDIPPSTHSKDAAESQSAGVRELKPASPVVYTSPEGSNQAQELVEEGDEESETEGEPEEEADSTDEETEPAEQVPASEEELVVELSAAEQIALSDTVADTDKVSEGIEDVAEEEVVEALRLSDEELEERENARLKRLEELGLVTKKQPAPTIAIDASLIMPSACAGAAISKVPVGLKFRYESSIMRGESLNALESLVALYRQCEEGEFVLAQNPLGREDATELLTQMRFDEVKYFFIQHRVSIESVQFPEAK